ncbi:MAG: dolichyl-phosphate beta-glucosyltransferase [Bryobacteraceae bacterium]
MLNEAHVLESSVDTVGRFLAGKFPWSWRLLIVDNGSTDGTAEVAQRLSQSRSGVSFLNLEQKGRGRALRHAWLQSDADAVCYMDVDLSTDLSCLPPLLAAVLDEGYDIATGSRLMAQSRVRRSPGRELLSRVYNRLVRLLLATRFSDAQCGFKALRRAAVERIVPQIQDQSWFFDTELLVLAEKQGLRIKDIPIAWIEDDDSRVRIVSTAWDDLKGLVRLRRQLHQRAVTAAVAPERRQP